MIKLRLLLTVIIVVVLSSCATKPVVTIDSKLSAEQVYALAKATTPTLCAYTGNVSVGIEVPSENIDDSVKALLSKECSDDYRIVILGLLNSPVATITSSNGEIQATSSDNNIRSQVARLARTYDSTVSELLRSPLFLPNETPTIDYTANGYTLLFNRGYMLEVNDQFYITKYTLSPYVYVEQLWSGNMIERLTLQDSVKTFTVKFLSENGWQ